MEPSINAVFQDQLVCRAVRKNAAVRQVQMTTPMMASNCGEGRGAEHGDGGTAGVRHDRIAFSFSSRTIICGSRRRKMCHFMEKALSKMRRGRKI